MNRHGFSLKLVFLAITVLLMAGLPAIAQSPKESECESQQQIDKWADELSKTSKLRYDKKYDEAIACYDRAIEISPNAEYKAETYFHKAQGLETWDRYEAIANYQKVLSEKPTAALRAETCFRLGSLHRNISLGKSEEEATQIVETEFSNENCLPYFEMGAAAAGEYDKYAMSCRVYVAFVYQDTGRTQEAEAILAKLAALDPSKAELFPDQFLVSCQSPRLFFVRKEETLQHVQMTREIAAETLVESCIVQRDDESTIARLQELCARYPKTLIAQEAENKIATIASTTNQS